MRRVPLFPEATQGEAMLALADWLTRNAGSLTYHGERVEAVEWWVDHYEVSIDGELGASGTRA